MRIAGAAIVFALLALAPATAEAHGGHGHLAAASHHTAPLPAQADAAASAESAQERAPEFGILAAAPVSGADNQSGCAGSCCKSAMVCCGSVIFAEGGEILSPPSVATRLVFRSSDSWTSLTPARLRRPPKSFA